MSAFKPKRISGAELTAQLAPATASLPPVIATAPTVAPQPVPAPRQRPAAVIQVNFKASEEFADLIAEAAEKAGSTRRLFARLMRDAGYAVPETDVNPPDNRRRARRDS